MLLVGVRPAAEAADRSQRRLRALCPDQASAQRVRPIRTGLKFVDRLGIMEVLWCERQLKRIAKGKAPQPGESGLAVFLKSAFSSGWGAFRTRRLDPGRRRTTWPRAWGTVARHDITLRPAAHRRPTTPPGLARQRKRT